MPTATSAHPCLLTTPNPATPQAPLTIPPPGLGTCCSLCTCVAPSPARVPFPDPRATLKPLTPGNHRVGLPRDPQQGVRQGTAWGVCEMGRGQGSNRVVYRADWPWVMTHKAESWSVHLQTGQTASALHEGALKCLLHVWHRVGPHEKHFLPSSSQLDPKPPEAEPLPTGPSVTLGAGPASCPREAENKALLTPLPPTHITKPLAGLRPHPKTRVSHHHPHRDDGSGQFQT